MKIIRKKTIILVILLLISFLLAGGTIYFYSVKVFPIKKQTEEQPEKLTHGPCLTDDEFADYPIDEKYDKEVKLPKLPLIINVRDKNTNRIKFSFQIENVIESYHPPELYKCGIYLVREFNFDYKKGKPLPNFRMEVWRYRYDSTGEKLAEENDFRIDPNENYLVLERSYLGKDDYALVIKDLKTREDVFVLTLDEILKKYPNISPGSFDLGVFTPDNKYLWGNIFEGSYDIAYFRIELGTWKTDILPSPPDLPSGAEREFNFKGYFAYVDITSFTGFEGVTEQIEEEAIKADTLKNLWIYNLFTKEKIKVASVDPGRRFNIQWISDTELEYELSSGEKKIYSIE